jgi:hypothetical protein
MKWFYVFRKGNLQKYQGKNSVFEIQMIILELNVTLD